MKLGFPYAEVGGTESVEAETVTEETGTAEAREVEGVETVEAELIELLVLGLVAAFFQCHRLCFLIPPLAP